MEITSPANPKISHLHELHTREGRASLRQFIVEGPRALTMALDAKAIPALTCYDPQALERTQIGRNLLGRLHSLEQQERDDSLVYVANERALSKASAAETSPGVVAAFPIEAVFQISLEISHKSPRNLTLILDGLSDPGNVGTILRSAAAAANTEILVLPGTADIFSPKVVRAASGAHFYVPLRSLTWEEIESLNKPVYLAETTAKTSYFDADLTQPIAVIIGNEAHGPSREARAKATGNIAIPISADAESLNAGVAASIIMFEAARQKVQRV